MIRLALHQLWGRRLQALAPLVALLVATIGFQAVLLSARVTQSHVQGVIAANWNPPYDLLVRPASLVPGLRPGDHLAQPNYLETGQGGISTTQVASVRRVPDVSVAAPLGMATVEYMWFHEFAIDLTSLPHTAPLTIYRVTAGFTTDGGVSKIPGRTEFVIVAGDKPPYLAAAIGPRTPMNIGGFLVDCPNWCFGPAEVFPYQQRSATYFPYQPQWAANRWAYVSRITAPMVTVDPAAEQALTGISSCLTGGRNLSERDPVVAPALGSEDNPAHIPVLVNSRPGFDDQVHATVEVSNAALPELQPSLPSLLLEGGTIFPFLDLPEPLLNQLSYHPFKSIDTNANSVWNGGGGIGFADGSLAHPSVNVAETTLRPGSFAGTVPKLKAGTVPDLSPITTHYDSFDKYYFDYDIDESKDIPFHTLDRMDEASGAAFKTKAPWHRFDIVGKYDPGCVSANDPLAKSAYDIYANPNTTASNGRRLGPNTSITNFASPMPLVMTNLAGGRFFSDPHRFAAGKGDAFLSVIRVKVTGTSVPGVASQKRLERVAAEIHRQTGLAVDIIKGSSTQPVAIDVPAGRFGRPAMTVHQDWLTENVAINFINAINRTTVVMSVVVAVVAGLLTMQATYATVRRRRGELVLLRAIGWPSWRIAALMELEVVTLGVVVALVALVVAAVMIVLGHPGPIVVAGLLVAAPAAIAITALAGVGPALTASRTRPLAALRGPGRIRRRRRLLARPAGLGIREALTTWRWQTLLGALATAVGALFLGAVLAISQGFHASLDRTTLAQQLASEVGPFDILLGVLAVVLGAGTAVSVVLVATRERLPHFATLRALGWSQRQVGAVVAAQAMTVGLLGGVLGVAALAAVGSRIHEGITLTPWNVLSPLALGVATGVVAALAALRLVYARVAVYVLRVG